MSEFEIIVNGNVLVIEQSCVDKNDFIVCIGNTQSKLDTKIEKSIYINNYKNIAFNDSSLLSKNPKISVEMNEDEFCTYWMKDILDKLHDINSNETYNEVNKFLKRTIENYKDQISTYPLDVKQIHNGLKVRVIVWNGSKNIFTMNKIPIKIKNSTGELLCNSIFECEVNVEPNEYGVSNVIIEEEAILNKEYDLSTTSVTF